MLEPEHCGGYANQGCHSTPVGQGTLPASLTPRAPAMPRPTLPLMRHTVRLPTRVR